MVNNSVKGRFQLKKDTEAHWNLARNFIPLAGEPIIYTVDENHTAPRIKIGDGSTYVVDLPFLSGDETQNPYVRSGTKEYWNTQIDYRPPKNMIIVYSNGGEITENNQTVNFPRIKISDGNSYVGDLPFVDDSILTVLENHINDSNIHITSAERLFWNNKLNYDNSILDENLILTRN